MRTMRSRRGLVALLLICLSLFLGSSGGVGAAAPSGDLRNLDSIEQFRDFYNAKVGVPRLVLLLSST